MKKFLSLLLVTSLVANVRAADFLSTKDQIAQMSNTIQNIRLNGESELVKKFLDPQATKENLVKTLKNVPDVNKLENGFSLGHYAAWNLLQNGSVAGVVALLEDGRFDYSLQASNGLVIRLLLDGFDEGHHVETGDFLGTPEQEQRWFANLALETLLSSERSSSHILDKRNLLIEALGGDKQARGQVVKDYYSSLSKKMGS